MIHFKLKCFKAGWNESLNLLRRDELEQQTACFSAHRNETSDHKEILVSDVDAKLHRKLHSTIKKKTLLPKKIFSCFNHTFKIFSPSCTIHSCFQLLQQMKQKPYGQHFASLCNPDSSPEHSHPYPSCRMRHRGTVSSLVSKVCVLISV